MSPRTPLSILDCRYHVVVDDQVATGMHLEGPARAWACLASRTFPGAVITVLDTDTGESWSIRGQQVRLFG